MPRVVILEPFPEQFVEESLNTYALREQWAGIVWKLERRAECFGTRMEHPFPPFYYYTEFLGNGEIGTRRLHLVDSFTEAVVHIHSIQFAESEDRDI